MLNLLKKLITFQSDKNHPEEIKKCFDFVVQYLKKGGLKVKTYSSEKKPSLVAAYRIKKHYQYILNGHLDVVPANYKNAFKPIIKGNRLYGRGTSDMKGVVAAMMDLMKEKKLKNSNTALMITCDEEVGGFNGVNYLLNKKNYSCDCAIIPDGGNNWQLVLNEKGVIHLKLEAQGKSAHGSRPWLGENAIEKLIFCWQEIKKRIPDTTSKNRWLLTVNLGKFSGGDATNKVPDFAQMYLDFRYPKKGDRQKILNLVKKTAKKIKGVSFQIQVEGDIMHTSKNNKYIKKILKIAKKEKINLKISKAHGASDGRFFSAKGIPVIMFKPKSSQPHINNEWINLKSLKKWQTFLGKFLLL